jgi:hypothetical protein
VIAGFKVAVVALMVAYVLPAYSILRRLADGRDDLALNGMKVEGSAAVGPSSAREVAGLMGVDWQSGELMLTFTASMRLPGRCRLELSTPESTKTLVAVSSNGKRRNEGGELPALQVAIDQICAVLAFRGSADGESRAAVERHLAALKVNSRLTSLGRFRGTVAYVLGDPGDAAPQLWIFKDHFNPARVRFTDDKQLVWDVHFFDYSSQATGQAFPRQVLVNKGSEPVLRLTTLKGDLRAKLDDALF